MENPPHINGTNLTLQPASSDNHTDCNSFNSITINDHLYSYLRNFAKIDICVDICDVRNNSNNIHNDSNESRMELDSHKKHASCR